MCNISSKQELDVRYVVVLIYIFYFQFLELFLISFLSLYQVKTLEYRRNNYDATCFQLVNIFFIFVISLRCYLFDVSISLFIIAFPFWLPVYITCYNSQVLIIIWTWKRKSSLNPTNVSPLYLWTHTCNYLQLVDISRKKRNVTVKLTFPASSNVMFVVRVRKINLVLQISKSLH